MTNAQALLLERLRHAGIVDVVAVEPATGGLAATAGIARRDDGSRIFIKTFAGPSSEGVFAAEADGLAALNELGGMPTPQVLLADEQMLVLSMLGPRPASETFWTEFAHLLAHLHTSTVHPRFGWHEDNWLGRRRQINTWNEDGFAFFAENRLLRWLGEPRVDAAPGR